MTMTPTPGNRRISSPTLFRPSSGNSYHDDKSRNNEEDSITVIEPATNHSSSKDKTSPLVSVSRGSGENKDLGSSTTNSNSKSNSTSNSIVQDRLATTGDDTISLHTNSQESVDLLADDDDDEEEDEATQVSRTSNRNGLETPSQIPTKPIASENNLPGSSSSSVSSALLLLSSASPAVSPATKTLNTLSQNMDDLRCPSPSRYMYHESTNSKVTSCLAQDFSTRDSATHDDAGDAVPWEKLSQDYEWFPVSLNPQDPTTGLGLVLQRDRFPILTHTNQSQSSTLLVHCQIRRITPQSCADLAGIRAGDWLCHAQPNATTTKDKNFAAPTLAHFERMQRASKERPFLASILRKRTQKSTSTTDNQVKSSSLPPTATTTPAVGLSSLDFLATICDSQTSVAMKKSTPAMHAPVTSPGLDRLSTLQEASQQYLTTSDEQQQCQPIVAAATPSKSKSSKSAEVPFCRLCTMLKGGKKSSRRQPRMHHAWCPKNSFYESSGAEELMLRIRQGCDLGCTTCQTEYRTGKLLSNSSTTTKSKKPNNKNSNPHSQACQQNQQRLEALAEEEERAEKEAKRKKKERSKDKQATKKSKPMNGSSTKKQEPKKKRDLPGGKTTASGPTPKKRATAGNDQMTTPKRVTALPKTPRTKTSSQQRDHQPLKSQWADTDEDPWGPHGFVEGDVLLYGPQQGIGHPETILTGPRFIIDPLKDPSNYRTTHQLPEEGLAVVQMRRDPSSRHPWGFSIHRDEFGGACLVKTVIPLSPASGAIYLGSGTQAGLRLHDMILLINNKRVGLLNEQTFDLELELSGPVLTLVVSRYKHAASTSAQLAASEQHMLRALDASCEDPRAMGWHEIGNGTERPRDSIAHPRLSIDSESSSIPVANAKNSNSTEPKEVDSQSVASTTGDERSDYKDDIHSQSSSPHGVGAARNGLPDSPSTNAGRSTVSEEEDTNSKEDAEAEKDDSQDWEEDMNTWNGCVCGKIHSRSSKVFWIQCEKCDSWYDVSQKCVGFSMKDAETLEHWSCWACPGEENSSTADQHSTPMTSPAPSPAKQPPASPSVSTKARQQTVDSKRLSDNAKEDGRQVVNKSDRESVKKDSESSERGSVVDEVVQATTDPTTSQSNGQRRRSQGTKGPSVENSIPLPKETSATDLPLAQTQRKVRTVSTSESDHAEDNMEPTGDQGKKVSVTTKRKLDRQRRTTADGCLLPKSGPHLLKDGTYRKPAGWAPSGHVWDKIRGVWSPRVQQKTSKAQTPARESRRTKETKPTTIREANVSRKRPIESEETAEETQTSAPRDSSKEGSVSTGSDSAAKRRLQKHRRKWNDRTTSDGCLLPKSGPFKMPDGTYRKPQGWAPIGYVWDDNRGAWRPIAQAKKGNPETKQQGEKQVSVSSKTQRSKAHAREKTTKARSKPLKPSWAESKVEVKGDTNIAFETGDLVFVHEHKWPGKKRQCGVAHVLRSYVNEDRVRHYDVKYPIGGSDKGIIADFVSAHSFG